MRQILLAACAMVGAPAWAQTVAPSYKPGAAVTGTNPYPVRTRCWNGTGWTDCGAAARESIQIAAANTPAAAVTVYGGDYLLTQICTAYGSLALQVLGPDGATWLTLLTRTTADTTGGSGVSLGAASSVRVVLTGTTGCNAVLARVPA